MTKPALKEATPEFEHMAKAVAKGACKYYPGVSFESLFAYYADAVGLPITNFFRSMSFQQWFYYLYLRFVFGTLCWIPGVIYVFSALTRFAIGLVVARSSTANWWPTHWKPPQVSGMDVFWTLETPVKPKVKNEASDLQTNHQRIHY